MIANLYPNTATMLHFNKWYLKLAKFLISPQVVSLSNYGVQGECVTKKVEQYTILRNYYYRLVSGLLLTFMK